MKFHTFAQIYWPKKPIWNRDIDKSVDEEFLYDVAARTATPKEQAFQTTLKAYEGIVFEKLNIQGNSKWVRPLGIYHRTRTLRGLRWCPECLETDPEPYFRRAWRMSFTSTCSKHGLVLADRCHFCGQPCMIHKREFLSCHYCNTNLTAHPRRKAKSVALQAEYRLQQMASNGVYGLPETGIPHSILYFDIWYRIMSLIVFGKRSERLRLVIADHYGGDPSPYSISETFRTVDGLTPHDLHKVHGMAERLMTGFPFRLVGLCAESDNWSSQIMKDMHPPRHNLVDVCRRYLLDPKIVLGRPRDRKVA